MIAPIDLLALPALLVLVEPDLGTAGIIILIGMSMFCGQGEIGFIDSSWGSGNDVCGTKLVRGFEDYQKRISTFIDPESDIQGAGWNAPSR